MTEARLVRGRGTQALLAASFTVACGLLLTLPYGAPAGSALLFAIYLGGFVILPGWLLYVVLAPERGGPMRQLAFGWVVGYTLESIFFMLTAAGGTRSLLVAFPVAAVLVLGLPARRKFRFERTTAAPDSGDPGPRFTVAVAAACIIAMGFFAISFFPDTPLPGSTSVSYSQDYSWIVSLAADALHHWPLTDPSVVGEPMPYHYFSILHFASASQVTGVDLSTVFFRLWPLPVIALIVLQFAESGRSLFRNVWIGLLAAALALMVGELQLLTFGGAQFTFGWFNYTLLVASPSFLFGMPFVIALFTLLGEQLSRPGGPVGSWVLVALVAVGAGGAKVSILPLVLAGLVIFALARFLVDRRLGVAPLVAIGVVGAVQAGFYLVLYKGHSSGLQPDLLASGFLNDQWVLVTVGNQIASWISWAPLPDAFDVIGLPFGFAGAFIAPLIGLFWIVRRSTIGSSIALQWLLSVFASGLATLVFVSTVASGNQLYTVFYGLMAGVMLSAAGLARAWSTRPDLPGKKPVLLWLGSGWVLVLALLVAGPYLLDELGHPVSDIDQTLFVYGAFLIAMAGLWFLAKRLLSGSSRAASLVVTAAVLATGLLDLPVTDLRNGITPAPPPAAGSYRLTPELYAALRWMRDETPEDSVFAVNNQYAQEFVARPVAYDYAAFSERRAFLAGWGYVQRVRDTGLDRVKAGFNPFAARKELNDRAFAGDRKAVDRLWREFGVRYLLVDEANGDPVNPEKLKTLGETVFSAPGVRVVKLDVPAGETG